MHINNIQIQKNTLQQTNEKKKQENNYEMVDKDKQQQKTHTKNIQWIYHKICSLPNETLLYTFTVNEINKIQQNQCSNRATP